MTTVACNHRGRARISSFQAAFYSTAEADVKPRNVTSPSPRMERPSSSTSARRKSGGNTPVISESERSSSSSTDEEESEEREDFSVEEEDSELADDEAPKCRITHRPSARRRSISGYPVSHGRQTLTNHMHRDPFATTTAGSRRDDSLKPAEAMHPLTLNRMDSSDRSQGYSQSPSSQFPSAATLPTSSPRGRHTTSARRNRRWSISGNVLTSMPHESLWDEAESAYDLPKMIRCETATRKMMLDIMAAPDSKATASGKQRSEASQREPFGVGLSHCQAVSSLGERRATSGTCRSQDTGLHQEQRQRHHSLVHHTTKAASHGTRRASESHTRDMVTGTGSVPCGKDAARGARVLPNEGLAAAVGMVQRLKESCLRSKVFVAKMRVEVE